MFLSTLYHREETIIADLNGGTKRAMVARNFIAGILSPLFNGGQQVHESAVQRSAVRYGMLGSSLTAGIAAARQTEGL
ncbi:hypothetical protein A4R35_18035 [Thermogemmatispora tikiterensis]|uniref:Uncharacterized protein n=1 Tax=Thermogemmatispora tikiterensis TaxID=1825093 RepID=A0A328VP46_9CHLR|nr:hypothetical protein A4R35_18035 [Thermogemmatispora tikiterensis]